MAKQLRDYVPALKFGAKISPNDLTGGAVNAYTGDIIYVDATNGSDTANAGRSFDDAYKTWTKAEDSASSNSYDQIIVAPNGTAGTAETGTITWDKNHITTVGATAPVSVAQRARILWTVDSTDPAMTVSGTGNQFLNLQLATFQASNDVLVNFTGERNFSNNTHYLGIGHDTAGNDTTARSLVITGAGENEFVNCTIGTDTITRSVANASLELTGSCPRNIFRNCLFPMFADNNAVLFMKANTGNCFERFLLLQDCLFNNPDVNGTATKLTIAFNLSTTGNGTIILNNSYGLGFTDWANNFAALHMAGITEQATNTTAGIMKVLA